MIAVRVRTHRVDSKEAETMKQQTLAEAHEAGKAGAELAAETSGEDWVTYAEGFLLHYLTNHPRMHVDDLWTAGLEQPKSPRALGQVIRRARDRRWISPYPVGVEFGEGARIAAPSTHSNGQLKTVWRSELFRGRP